MENEEALLSIWDNPELSDTQRLLNLFQARGFLVELDADGEIVFSDNSLLPDDRNDMDTFLRDHDVGYCIGNTIMYSGEVSEAKKLFTEVRQISFEVDWKFPELSAFAQKKYGNKVSTMSLDPYVARYVKAVSAIGFDTEASCDGCDKGGRVWYVRYVGIEKGMYKKWHDYIWRIWLDRLFPDIAWNEMHIEVSINRSTKFQQYYYLNKAAELLYKSRFILREAKQSAVRSVPNQYWYEDPEKAVQLFFRHIENEGFINELLSKLRNV